MPSQNIISRLSRENNDNYTRVHKICELILKHFDLKISDLKTFFSDSEARLQLSDDISEFINKNSEQKDYIMSIIPRNIDFVLELPQTMGFKDRIDIKNKIGTVSNKGKYYKFRIPSGGFTKIRPLTDLELKEANEKVLKLKSTIDRMQKDLEKGFIDPKSFKDRASDLYSQIKKEKSEIDNGKVLKKIMSVYNDDREEQIEEHTGFPIEFRDVKKQESERDVIKVRISDVSPYNILKGLGFISDFVSKPKNDEPRVRTVDEILNIENFDKRFELENKNRNLRDLPQITKGEFIQMLIESDIKDYERSTGKSYGRTVDIDVEKKPVSKEPKNRESDSAVDNKKNTEKEKNEKPKSVSKNELSKNEQDFSKRIPKSSQFLILKDSLPTNFSIINSNFFIDVEVVGMHKRMSIPTEWHIKEGNDFVYIPNGHVTKDNPLLFMNEFSSKMNKIEKTEISFDGNVPLSLKKVVDLDLSDISFYKISLKDLSDKTSLWIKIQKEKTGKQYSDIIQSYHELMDDLQKDGYIEEIVGESPISAAVTKKSLWLKPLWVK